MSSAAPPLGSILLGLLAEVPEGAPPVGGRDVTGEPRLLVDGELDEAESGRTFPVVDPSTAREIGVAADGSAGDMERAIDAAERSSPSPRGRPTPTSAHAACASCSRPMRDDAETLRRDLVAEIGCAVRMTYGDQLDRPIEKLGFYADLAERYAYTPGSTAARPAGGVLSASRSGSSASSPRGTSRSSSPRQGRCGARCGLHGRPEAVAALAVVGDAPRAARRGATEIPPGVLNVVTSSSAEVAAALTTDPRVDAVAFTGSTTTGKAVMAASAGTVKRVLLELGGKAANVMLDDADLEAVVPLAAAFVCFNAGQSCILPSRLLVPRSRLDECVELAVGGSASVPVGDPTDPDVFMGPLMSEEQRDRVRGLRRGRQGRRRAARDGRVAGRGSRRRLLLRADAVRRRRPAQQARAGGDLRARALGHPVRATTTMRSRSPTARSTASPDTSGAATRSARSGSRGDCAPGWWRQRRQVHRRRASRSAGGVRAGSGGSGGSPGSRSSSS